MCDMQQQLEQRNSKTIIAYDEGWDKLHITANTSYILKCLLEYQSQYIPAERRHRSRCCTSRNTREKILPSQSELFRQSHNMRSQLVLWEC